MASLSLVEPHHTALLRAPASHTPSSMHELSALVAHASRQGRRVHALGAGRSFSPIAATDGLLIRTDALRSRLPLPPLRRGWDPATLVRVGCGCRVRELQLQLMSEHRMLENTPAFTGQTLAGAVSTASHGTGRSFGPICDLVVSVDLVLDQGRWLRLEPTEGPTDPRRYAGPLVQSDALFRAVLVGLGAFGIHASYSLRTVPLVHLLESRRVVPLEEGLRALRESPARHSGLLFNPYPDRDGQLRASLTERVIHPEATGWERLRPRQRWWPRLFSTLPLDRVVLAAAHRAPRQVVPWLLNRVVGATQRPRFIGPAPVVMDNFPLNQCAPAHAIEASVPLEEMERAVARVVRTAGDEAARGRWLTGPVAVRTVAASQQLLAPSCGRASAVLEVISLRRSRWGRPALRAHADTLDALGARPHFGLDVLTVRHARDLGRLFPGFRGWQDALQQLDPRGRFDTPLMDRLELRARAHHARTRPLRELA